MQESRRESVQLRTVLLTAEASHGRSGHPDVHHVAAGELAPAASVSTVHSIPEYRRSNYCCLAPAASVSTVQYTPCGWMPSILYSTFRVNDAIYDQYSS